MSQYIELAGLVAYAVVFALTRRYHGGWGGFVSWTLGTFLQPLFYDDHQELRGSPARVLETALGLIPVLYFAGWEWTPLAAVAPLFFVFDPMADHKLVWLRWLVFAAVGYVIANRFQKYIPAIGHGFIERAGWMAVGELWAGASFAVVFAMFLWWLF